MTFPCKDDGFLRHWLLSGPRRTPYSGPRGSDSEMRRQVAATDHPPLPDSPRLGEPGPGGDAWRYHWPGWNPFVEQSAFFHQLEHLDLYAVTQLQAPAARLIKLRLWAVGRADLWLNGTDVDTLDAPDYMYLRSKLTAWQLAEGPNLVHVRLQALGVRDTRLAFGIQLLEDCEDCAVRLPAGESVNAELAAADVWLRSVRADAESLAAPSPPPSAVEIRSGDVSLPWSDGVTSVPLPEAAGAVIDVRAEVADQPLVRRLELPSRFRPFRGWSAPTADAHRRAYLEHLAHGRNGRSRKLASLVAGRVLEQPAGEAAVAAVMNALDFVEARNDCADFSLAELLRLASLGGLPEECGTRFREVVLGFRYWTDERGRDAMCFGSENHRILFHGCQYLAGLAFPDDYFPPANRTGREQAAVGLLRCAEWLEEIAAQNGFAEFLSSSYLPITAAAVLNLVDFGEDDALRAAASGCLDRILRDLARHSFDGVIIAPQGRVYRGVLSPENTGSQGLLYYAAPAAAPALTDWAVFPASSPSYAPPEDIAELMHATVDDRTRQAGVEISLRKRAGYLLTSLTVPGANGPSSTFAAIQAGNPGYQQHLWQLSLNRHCHIFVTHPGEHIDLGCARPGYWYGNGCFPRLEQRHAMVLAIYRIPDSHPVGFTHAHWPTDVFSREERHGQWVLAQAGDGFAGLWCSLPLVPHDQVLSGRELRAVGRDVAWLCVAGDRESDTDFAAFGRRCRSLAPAFAQGVLSVGDTYDMAFSED